MANVNNKRTSNLVETADERVEGALSYVQWAGEPTSIHETEDPKLVIRGTFQVSFDRITQGTSRIQPTLTPFLKEAPRKMSEML